MTKLSKRFTGEPNRPKGPDRPQITPDLTLTGAHNYTRLFIERPELFRDGTMSRVFVGLLEAESPIEEEEAAPGSPQGRDAEIIRKYPTSTAAQIAKLFKVEAKTIANRVNILRNKYGTSVVPYKRERKGKVGN